MKVATAVGRILRAPLPIALAPIPHSIPDHIRRFVTFTTAEPEVVIPQTNPIMSTFATTARETPANPTIPCDNNKVAFGLIKSA